MNIFWPDIQDKNDAHKACGQGAGVAFFVALVTGIVAFLQMNGKASFLPQIGGTALIDAGLFLAIGIGICFHSRLAALAGLLLYVGERIYMMKMAGPNAGGMISGILFTLVFTSSVRGAFAWHEFRKQENEDEGRPASASIMPRLGDSASAVSDTPKKQSRIMLIMVSFILLLTFAVGGYFLYQKVLSQKSSSSVSVEPVLKGMPLQQENRSSPPVADRSEAGASTNSVDSKAVHRTFHLKSGATISGRVIQDDEVYYTVETSGKRQEIVIKEDIASEE